MITTTKWTEAKEIINESIRDLELNITPQLDIGTLGTSLEALEKQIPKKPKVDTDLMFNFEGEPKAYINTLWCSSCGEGINENDKYCVWCGQAIDWSEEDDI